MSRKAFAIVSLAASTALLVGCTPPGEQDSAKTTVTVDAAESASTGQEQHIAAAPASQRDHLNSILMGGPTPGEPITISGAPATMCLTGDGFGIRLLAAGENTSCEFARAVMGRQVRGHSPSEGDVLDKLQSPVDVVSPVTDETYSISCSVDADRLATCTGGNGARVYMY